ncbi:helix-turn-helix transcriptional regulator [Kluyvera ascorbata]|uniref:helix-turn-helix transcriptional regulator n=1 Tax=Kluyvera ascorbata TaxID=51288 RepID=UPI00204C0200|nr:AlpA family phage regulatory protein [Kluyvera ascorbata]UPQ70137.1 AlpA family phage regulatory protein [Kluyvera ascorbata]
MHSTTVKILRIRDICQKIGIGRSTVYDWINPKSPRYDASFPKRLRLGKQSVGWLESEIDNWILQRNTVKP